MTTFLSKLTNLESNCEIEFNMLKIIYIREIQLSYILFKIRNLLITSITFGALWLEIFALEADSNFIMLKIKIEIKKI